MKMLAWGLAIVLIDVRINGVDIVADPIGWVLCVAALVNAAELTRSRWFRLAIAGAAVGGVASLDEYLNPPTGWLVESLAAVAMTAVVFGTCSGIIEGESDPDRQAKASLIRWLDVSLTVLVLAFTVAADDVNVEGGEALLVLMLVLPTLAVMIWFIVFVYGTRLVPPDRSEVTA